MGVYLGNTYFKDTYIGGPTKDFSAVQGPCPDGFHVPFKSEFEELNQILFTTFGLSKISSNLKTYLKFPLAGDRNYNTGGVEYQDSRGYWWSCTYDNGFCHLSSRDVGGVPTGTAAYGRSIRGFRNYPVIPDNTWTTLYDGSSVAQGAGIFHNITEGLISMSGDGIKWLTLMDKNLGATTVYNSGDTLSQDNCGKYYERGNIYGFARSGDVTTRQTGTSAVGYGPGNYFRSTTYIAHSSWANDNPNLRGGETGVQNKKTPIKNSYKGTNKIYPDITTPGIYHNADRKLISLSSDGITWITIMDRNLGATTNDVSSQDSYGSFYQWGNNSGFPTSGFQIVTSRVNASSYGPGNYYNNALFRKTSSNKDWSTVVNDDLWGADTNTNEARQGPCPAGYHVPSVSDKAAMVIALQNILGRDVTTSDVKSYLFMPESGYLPYNSGTYTSGGGYWWLTGYSSEGSYPNGYIYGTSSPNYSTSSSYNRRGTGYNIRAFKNESVQPDRNRTVLYQ